MLVVITFLYTNILSFQTLKRHICKIQCKPMENLMKIQKSAKRVSLHPPPPIYRFLMSSPLLQHLATENLCLFPPSSYKTPATNAHYHLTTTFLTKDQHHDKHIEQDKKHTDRPHEEYITNELAISLCIINQCWLIFYAVEQEILDGG